MTLMLPDRYVPNPSPSVFRTTKNNHNILQGVAHPDLRLTKAAKDNFDSWILKNGLRWTAEGGPLALGGVDVAFIGACRILVVPEGSSNLPCRRSSDARPHSPDSAGSARLAYRVQISHRDSERSSPQAWITPGGGLEISLEEHSTGRLVH